MAKKQDKQNKTIRSAYYLHQISPIIGYSIVLATVLIGKSLVGEYYPITSKNTLDSYKTTIRTMESTVTSLNSQKQSNLQEKQYLEAIITDLKAKKEADGSLRFYTINLPAYGRYVEFRANASNVEIIDVDIHEEENTIDYVILGDYNSLVAFFNALETREIYYIESFEMTPSLNNQGSYVKFTANFNLDSTITQRYERKIKFENSDTNNGKPLSDSLNTIPQDDTLGTIDIITEDEANNQKVDSTTVPDDTMNTGKTPQPKPDTNGQNQTTPQATEQPTTPIDTVVVEPIN